MKIHLAWIRVTAVVIGAGVGMQQAAAQYAPYAPYRPSTPQPAAAAPQQAAQNSYTPYTAYRTPAPTTSYASPAGPQYATGSQYPTASQYATGSQYAQPTSAYPQYPQTSGQYPSTYGSYPYVAQQPAELPAPTKSMNTSAARPSTSAAVGAPMNGNMPAEGMGGAPGGCGCNGIATYGAGDYYNTSACGCNSGGYPNCGISNYFNNDCGPDNQWFGGVYFLEMGRTNESPVKLTAEIPAGTVYPYYPPSTTTVVDSRDVSFDFREGVEFRIGSTFTIGAPCSSCQTGCNSNYGACGPTCGCGSCAPTTYAWEFAWWGLDDQPSTETAVYTVNRLVGMKNFVGAQYDFGGGGFNPVNGYYGYGLPVQALGANPQVLAQRVSTDFKAQNLELNVIRFPVCDACNTGCGGGGCNGGCDTCGCNGGGCDDCGGGLGFSMYGSCGVRYFHMDDDFFYADEFNPNGGAHAYDGFTYDNQYELQYDVRVKNNLVGPQLGWTSDYCWRKWNFFCNSTFGIFENHMSATQRMWSGGGDAVTLGDGSNFNVRSNKDAVAFLGELRVGTAYDFTCHWRGVIAYRAVAITGVATASTQLKDDYMDRASVAIIDSDNSVIIHGAQVGAECRY